MYRNLNSIVECHAHIYFTTILCLLVILLATLPASALEIDPPQDSEPLGLRLATFDVDATPPIGHKLNYGVMNNSWDLSLRAKGIILFGIGQPVVLLAVDWIGIANESQDEFKRAIASAAGTVPERIAVHTLHQHDAPVGDIKSDFVIEVTRRLETAVKYSLGHAQPVTHMGLGTAPVYKVASNRRIIGPDGFVRKMRYTSCRDSALRAEPEGLVDPVLSLVSFWNGTNPLAVVSFYAVHPQSYDHTGVANPDYPGIARFLRQLAVPDALHVHFNGAGGNLGAGKYNDGSHENRGVLAERLADGMKRAWEATVREPIITNAAAWLTEPVALKPNTLKGDDNPYVRRYNAGGKIDLHCLALGRARILFMPGELFVEYQLAAKAMRPDLFVAMAAYGDYGPGYIPTAKAFKEGGYEPGASRVTPQAEEVLMTGIRKFLTQEISK
ncbi:MAG: hypothetical protein WEB30_06575 [Cyclobacteriaceae bacterium]